MNQFGRVAACLSGPSIIVTSAKHNNKLPDDGLSNRNMLGHFDVHFNASFNIFLGTEVAQWLRCCATNRQVAGSIPAGVIGIFH